MHFIQQQILQVNLAQYQYHLSNPRLFNDKTGEYFNALVDVISDMKKTSKKTPPNK